MSEPPNKRWVLVVEDDALVRDAVVWAIRDQADLAAVEAENGAAALQTMRGIQVDLVLFDLAMPEVGGFELAERLRAAPATRDLPLIAITALDSAAVEQRALAAGCRVVLHKPFNLNRLVETIRSVLAESDLRRV